MHRLSLPEFELMNANCEQLSDCQPKHRRFAHHGLQHAKNDSYRVGWF